MKKILLTSLAGILAVSAANAFDIAPYASIKGGYSVTDIAVKGDSLKIDGIEIGTYVDPLDVRVHTDGVWSVNPAVGAKFGFEDFGLATFRVEAEFALNQDAKKEISVAEFGEQFGVKMQNWGIMANAYMDFRTNCYVKPFISAGLGYGHSKFDVRAIEFGSEEVFDFLADLGIAHPWKDNNLIWSVGGGLMFDVTENIAIDAQYRYMNYGNVTVEIPDLGSVDVKDVMHQFMLGARYTF